MKWEFTYRQLGEYFAFLKTQGTISSFANMNKVWNPIVLRHDVDLSIVEAYNLAMVEVQNEVRSTFFVRVASETYNVFSKQSIELLRYMIVAGFEIGLHFDPSIYPDCPEGKIFDNLLWESLMLEEKLAIPIRAISLHNPSQLLSRPLLGKYFIDAYDPSIWTDKNYISDSCMDFRDKDPFELVRIAPRPVQILLHPLHYSDYPESYIDKMGKYLYLQTVNIDADYRDNTTYIREIGNNRLVDIVLKGRE